MEEGFLFKDVFNSDLLLLMSKRIESKYSKFDSEGFTCLILKTLDKLELKERSNLISDCLFKFLPGDYSKALSILLNSFDSDLEGDILAGFEGFYYMPIAGFVSKYGTEEMHFQESMNALLEITKRFTSEDAIRPFIRKYPDACFAKFNEWVNDDNMHVRRLVSEGTRPRLPWSTPLQEFKDDPSRVLDILDKLNQDTELYVRRSVANNLNDICKDNPDLVIKRLKQWSKIKNEGTEWIIKHASRTMLKQGNKEVLDLLGYPTDLKLDFNEFKMSSESCKRGEAVSFSFDLKSLVSKSQNLMIDYIVHFRKANGKTAAKVFKLAKKNMKGESSLSLIKKISFKAISTRKYYVGQHFVEIQINGNKMGMISFDLK